MSSLIEHLRSFDRKERFAVFREILRFNEMEFPLDGTFREELAGCIDEKQIPDKVFCATDYHLDWIELAVNLAMEDDIPETLPVPSKEFNSNQQDIDLLIAFHETDKPSTTYIVLIEAKAYSSWSNPQLRDKINRLREIFGDSVHIGKPWRVHLVLLTNKVSDRIDTEGWPDWATRKNGKPNWLKYHLPERWQIRRCKFNRKLSKTGPMVRFDRVP